MSRQRIPTLRQTFAANLRAARKAFGLSQEALAHAAGLDRTFVGQVERGTRNLSIDNIERLAQALHVEAAALMWPRFDTTDTVRISRETKRQRKTRT